MPARWAVAIATVGGVGFTPWATGTAGSLVAVLLFGVAATASGALVSASVTIPLGLAVGLAACLLFAVGIRAAERAEAVFGRVDDGRIVVDELVGQTLALLPLLAFLPGLTRFEFFFGLVTAFVAFRGFDIAKPGPVRWAERRFEGGLGVMADDGVAGLLAAVVTGAGVTGIGVFGP